MTYQATLELHFINVGQGDSILIVNRDLELLAHRVKEKAGDQVFGTLAPIDHLPFAISEKVDLYGTVAKAVLIDGGDDEYGGDVVAYLEAHGVLNARVEGYVGNLDVVISHYHDDHIGGLRSLFKKRVLVPKARTKANGVTVHEETVELKRRYRPARVYLTAPDPKEDPYSQRLDALRQDINDAAMMHPAITEVTHVLPGGLVEGGGTGRELIPLEIRLGNGAGDIPITLTAYAASRAVFDPASNKLTKVKSGMSTPDQNDRSIMFILQYGSFRAYLGGDLAGSGGEAGGNKGANAIDPATKRFFSLHADVESVLNPVLTQNLPRSEVAQAGHPKFQAAGQCMVLKANHHASSSSVDVYTLSTTRPSIAVIPAGVRSRFHRHPTQNVLNRMSNVLTPEWECRDGTSVANTLSGIYLSEVAKTYKGKSFDVEGGTDAYIMGDVIVRPLDQSVVEMQGSTDFETPLRVQVYGTGEQTAVEDGRTELRPVSTQMARQYYPIGPIDHTSYLS
jgi:beta-lactamase superfamily II metal-dependent hydrolase